MGVKTSIEAPSYSVRGLANWILDFAESRGHGLTNMAINKLVFFAYEAVLLKHGRKLTTAKIEAWDHGPVFRELYQDFKRHEHRPISSRASFYSVASGNTEISKIDLAPEDEAEIVRTLESLIGLTASQLRELSHVEGGAWHRVWGYDGYANPGMEITPQTILKAAAEGSGGRS